MTDLKHSFPPEAGPGTRVLVLGSLPGERSLAQQQYYAHPQNQFWKLMSGVIKSDLTPLAYEARLATLIDHGVGLWDVVASARRTGSSDAAIRDLSANDVAGLVRGLPALRAIGFNGATALKHGLRQLGDVTDTLAIVPLPSSSALHSIGLAAKQAAWDRLRPFLE